MKQPCVYIAASNWRGTLYIGVTSNLVARMQQHRDGVVQGFTKCYGVHDLVWYELHGTMDTAIHREKTLKRWKRAWKVELIEQRNPLWRDLFFDVVG